MCSKKKVSADLPVALVERAEALAAEAGVSRTHILWEALETYFHTLDKATALYKMEMMDHLQLRFCEGFVVPVATATPTLRSHKA